MKPRRTLLNIFWIVMILVLIGVVISLLSKNAPSTDAETVSPEVEGNVVARVNGKPIYEERLNTEVQADLNKYRKYGMLGEDPNLIRNLQTSALDKLIGEELLRQESRKLTIENIDTRVEQRLKELEEMTGHGPRMEKYLKMRNLTRESLQESLRNRIYLDEYLKQQGISEPNISEKTIRQAYEQHLDRYVREETIKVSHILIAVDENAESETKELARQKAQQIRGEILNGKDFAEMAKQYSNCNSAAAGGNLDYIKKGYMPKEFDDVAFAMETDAVSEVVKTRFGYHIIKVLDKRPGGTIPYEEVKDFIAQYLQKEESQKRLENHLVALKSQAKIDLLLPE